MSEALLELCEVTKSYSGPGGDGFALQPTSLVVEPGAWLALEGRSGAGKTTLLQIMATLDRPDTGRVYLFGREVTRDSESSLSGLRRSRLGIVYQQLHFIEHLTVWQNVTSRLVPEGVSSRQRRRQAREILASLGLEHGLDRLPGTLSGGEQQRVALARAVLHRPQLLIADEPTSNADAATAEVIVAALRDLQASGTSIVVSTHDPVLVAAADRRVELVAGELVP